MSGRDGRTRTCPRILLGWGVLQLQLLVGLVPASGVVLCVGPDGHVDIEVPEAAGSCGGVATPDDCPSGCADVVIASAAADRRSAQAVDGSGPVAWAAAPIRSTVFRWSLAPPLRTTRSSSLALVRTVVLVV